MSKETLVFVFGIILLVIPFLGIPEEWRQYLVAVIGALLVFIGYALRRIVFLRRIERQSGERASDSFVESTEVVAE
tara:strand:+ start:318 stop:545 length:228 start_codon:yes stop_codon:yes gene_type:complete